MIVRLDEHARLLVPSSLRKRLGLRQGDAVSVELTSEGDLRVRPVRDNLRAAKGLFRAERAPGESVVDALIAERREEGVRESDGRDLS